VPAGTVTFEEIDEQFDGKVEFDIKSIYPNGKTDPRGKFELEWELEVNDEEREYEFEADRIQEWMVFDPERGYYQGTGNLEIEAEDGPGPEERTIRVGFLVSMVDATSGKDKIRIILWELDTFRVIFDNQRTGDDIREIIPIDTTPVTNPLMDAEATFDISEGKIKLIPLAASSNDDDDDDDDLLYQYITESQQAAAAAPPASPSSKINDVVTKIIVNFDPEIMDADLLEGKGLVGKLSRAIKNVDAGNDEGACNKLTKTVKQLNKLIKKNKIDQILGEELIADVEEIKLDLNCAQFS